MLLGCARVPTFTGDDAMRVCVALQTCVPETFNSFLVGPDLASCASEVNPFFPRPGTSEARPATRSGLELQLADVYRCVLAAHGDCGATARCWNQQEVNLACAPSDARGLSSGTCTDGGLVGCVAAGVPFSFDCGPSGGACGNRPAIFSSLRTCGLRSCSRSTDAFPCQGDTVEFCLGETTMTLDCSRQGMTCGSLDGGVPTCIPTGRGAQCDGAFGDRCDGDQIVRCVDGHEARIDCQRNVTHRRCEQGQCVATGTQCTENTGAQCDGDVLTLCRDGFNVRFDCRAEGFGGCTNGRCAPR